MVLRVPDLDVARGRGLHADEAAVQIGRRLLRADLDDPILAHAPFEGLTVHLSLDVEGDPVPRLRPARHLPPFPPPLSQGLDHTVDVGLPHLGDRPANLDGLQIREPDVGKHLEDRRVLEARPRSALHRIDPRLAGGMQLLARERVGEAGAHQLAHHLVAHRRAEPPGHDLHRRLAGPEPRDPRGPKQIVEPRPDLPLDPFLGKLDRQAALETGRGLYRDLHVFTSAPCRGGAAPAGTVHRTLTRALREKLVRKERFELSRVAPLAPKASASTDSATFATLRNERGASIAKMPAGSASEARCRTGPGTRHCSRRR